MAKPLISISGLGTAATPRCVKFCLMARGVPALALPAAAPRANLQP
jgi:hypothetical protein